MVFLLSSGAFAARAIRVFEMPVGVPDGFKRVRKLCFILCFERGGFVIGNRIAVVALEPCVDGVKVEAEEGRAGIAANNGSVGNLVIFYENFDEFF